MPRACAVGPSFRRRPRLSHRSSHGRSPGNVPSPVLAETDPSRFLFLQGQPALVRVGRGPVALAPSGCGVCRDGSRKHDEDPKGFPRRRSCPCPYPRPYPCPASSAPASVRENPRGAHNQRASSGSSRGGGEREFGTWAGGFSLTVPAVSPRASLERTVLESVGVPPRIFTTGISPPGCVPGTVAWEKRNHPGRPCFGGWPRQAEHANIGTPLPGAAVSPRREGRDPERTPAFSRILGGERSSACVLRRRGTDGSTARSWVGLLHGVEMPG